MPNMAHTVAKHNKGVLSNKQQRAPPPCKCGANCPVGGQCTKVNVVYEAKIKERNSQNVETYTGLTYRPFKTRYKEHLYDMAHPDKRTSSKLAGHIWNLTDKGIHLTGTATNLQIRFKLN